MTQHAREAIGFLSLRGGCLLLGWWYAGPLLGIGAVLFAMGLMATVVRIAEWWSMRQDRHVLREAILKAAVETAEHSTREAVAQFLKQALEAKQEIKFPPERGH